MKKIIIALTTAFTLAACSSSQSGTTAVSNNNSTYWQQHVDYKMNVDMNVNNYQYTGDQTLVYTNNSPETLDRVYYHLFFNAFQPGSEMDVRSRTITDPDPRVGSRIAALSPNEIGYLKIANLKQDGKALETREEGTILVVKLAKALAPGASTTLTLDFNGQVPVQIRRSGRNNKEGVALSMTQWYPKLAEFDKEGWHANPYIGREFHGVWGNFDVKLTLDKSYTVGGTGYLQNAKEIGHGYDKPNSGPAAGRNGKLTWHFNAPMVHDFAWGADPKFVHDIYKGENGVDLHFLYKDNDAIRKNWKDLQPKTAAMLKFYNENVGQYPYKQYSVIQGGDGGMEYAMCTLITGERSFGSLVGVTAHEMAHAWFQHILATNESKHEWMDEGFTSFISDEAMNVIMDERSNDPQANSIRGYIGLATSGKEQPLSTHADRYEFNRAYGASAYSKGATFLAQLGYIIGDDVRDQVILEYYNQWKFKHPDPNDFKRVAERVSGFELDWYLVDFTQTTNTIDYAVAALEDENGNAAITLERKGQMPMPLDLTVTMKNGSEKKIYIPLEEMRNQKKTDRTTLVAADWAWAYPLYTLSLPGVKISDIQEVTIDPQNHMADVDRKNNSMKF